MSIINWQKEEGFAKVDDAMPAWNTDYFMIVESEVVATGEECLRLLLCFICKNVLNTITTQYCIKNFSKTGGEQIW